MLFIRIDETEKLTQKKQPQVRASARVLKIQVTEAWQVDRNLASVARIGNLTRILIFSYNQYTFLRFSTNLASAVYCWSVRSTIYDKEVLVLWRN